MPESQEPWPSLKPLHPHTSLSAAKLAALEKLSSDDLKRSLLPAQEHCLKTRPDGTILDGHHRIHVLRGRGEPVDALPREILDLAHERRQAMRERQALEAQWYRDQSPDHEREPEPEA